MGPFLSRWMSGAPASTLSSAQRTQSGIGNPWTGSRHMFCCRPCWIGGYRCEGYGEAVEGDANDAARRRRADMGRREDDEDEDEDPYFMLFEQFSSLLRKEAFPSWTHIRDMSRESYLIRRSGCISLQPPSPLLFTTIVEPSSRTSVLNLLTKPRKLAQAAQMAKRDKELAQEQGRRVIRFWTGVVEKCMEHGVGLMNWRGEEVC